MSATILSRPVHPFHDRLSGDEKAARAKNKVAASRFFIILLSVGFALTTSGISAGEISGVVKLPTAKRENMKVAVRYSGQTGAGAKVPPAARAVVYLNGKFPDSTLAPLRRKAKVISQKNFQFLPGVLPIVVGTQVSFPNSDSDYHNVFSYSKTKRFDLGRFLSDESPPLVVFDKTGTVKLFCEIHRHMRATILILDTPYFTTVDDKGRFNLTNLPAGNFELVAWVNDRKVLRKKVTVTAKSSQMVNFGEELSNSGNTKNHSKKNPSPQVKRIQVARSTR